MYSTPMRTERGQHANGTNINKNMHCFRTDMHGTGTAHSHSIGTADVQYECRVYLHSTVTGDVLKLRDFQETYRYRIAICVPIKVRWLLPKRSICVP